jgi:phosphopentomutase
MEASSLVKNDPNFEAIRASGKGAVKQVVQLIERTFDQDGILLTVEEAAQAVEDHLVEEATKLTRIGKIQQRLAANAKTAQKPVQTTGQSPQASKTLTNTMSTARPLSARERALLAFKGELK